MTAALSLPHQKQQQVASSKMAFSAFVVAVLATSANGFRSTTRAPFAVPFCPKDDRGSQIARYEDDWAHVFKAKKRLKKPVYDLGVGKNQPVKTSFQYSSTSAIYNRPHEAGQFIVEHEAVREYPSPATTEATQLPIPVNKPKNILPIVQPIRKAQDLLTIQDHENHPNRVIMMSNHEQIYTARDEPLTMDVNTIWVEMMLHDEMSKIAASAPN